MTQRREAARTRAMIVAALVLLCAACAEEPKPRGFKDFMDDSIARDGTLARCNQDREANLRDAECANARRAAAVVAVQEERARRAQLELSSQRKLAELRDRIAREQQREREAAAAAELAARDAYEALWVDPLAAEASTTAADALEHSDPNASAVEPRSMPQPFNPITADYESAFDSTQPALGHAAMERQLQRTDEPTNATLAP